VTHFCLITLSHAVINRALEETLSATIIHGKRSRRSGAHKQARNHQTAASSRETRRGARNTVRLPLSSAHPARLAARSAAGVKRGGGGAKKGAAQRTGALQNAYSAEEEYQKHKAAALPLPYIALRIAENKTINSLRRNALAAARSAPPGGEGAAHAAATPAEEETACNIKARHIEKSSA